MRRTLLMLLLLAATSASAQESKLGADWRKESASFSADCSSFKSFFSCAQVLFTGQPLHIAVGSIAPQNGFGAGLAYAKHKDSDTWSNSWSADAIGSSNASWRAGIYLTFVHTPVEKSDQTMGVPSDVGDVEPYHEYPVYNLFAQSISLNKLTFFGEGPATTTAGRTFFGMTEHIFGGNIVQPIYPKLNLVFL